MTRERSAAVDWMAGGGQMGNLIRSMDWSQTPLGPIESWPQSLRTTVSLCLASNFPISLVWGPQYTQIYNDGYWPICGGKHPQSMGQDFTECWASAWPAIGQAFEQALAGETSFLVDQRVFLDRNGYLEEAFFTFSFSAIRDETGGIGGLFHPVTETTGKILSERRARALRDLTERTGKTESSADAMAGAAQSLGAYAFDLPFALLYSLDSAGRKLKLMGSTGLEPGTSASPLSLDLAEPAAFWPMQEAVKSGASLLVENLRRKLESLRCGPYPEGPDTALITPIFVAGDEHAAGVVITGCSARLPLDEMNRGFHTQVAAAIKAAITNARAYEQQRKRAEALAELDRAKTTFFSNVSHEFRTPLTLMLGPLEEGLADQTLNAVQRERLELAHRNSRRLLKLVNTLLEFSRLEAGRLEAHYEPLDLPLFTSELAGVFRSAIEKAGLRLTLDCPPQPEPVFVDKEMWEKIVFNLLSNAIKFTFEGEIAIRLRWCGGHIELSVSDTGVGIPAEELPRVFERFHRVQGTRSRSYEGTGIGLALIQELARLHGGEVRVRSIEGQGTTFFVTIRTGKTHLPPDRVSSTGAPFPVGTGAAAFLEESNDWLRQTPHEATAEAAASPLTPPLAAPSHRPRILLADDNADMRDYVRRILLAQHYTVDAVGDGQAALDSARRQPPDLILSDVMMPGLDGFGLLEKVRAEAALHAIPVILLSARAGEESRIEGLQVGADDYLTKPFSARELVARVGTHVEMSRLRRDAASHAESQRNEAALREGRDRLSAINAELKQRVEELQNAGVELRDSRLAALKSMEDAVHSRQRVEILNLELNSEINERKRAEEALRQSRAALEFALETAQVGDWDLDLIHDTSRRSLRHDRCFGYEEPLEVWGFEQFIQHVHPEDRARVEHDFREALSGLTDWQFECRVIWPDGSVHWIATHGSIYRTEEGRPTRMLGIVANITARKAAEESLLHALQEAERASRAKDDFLAALSHELRTPLTPVLMSAAALEGELSLPVEVRDQLGMMRRNIELEARLIDDLLDLTRISRGKLQIQPVVTDVHRLLEHTAEITNSEVTGKQVDVRFMLDAPRHHTIGDPARLQQVFWNIVKNALKFTPSGGRVVVHTSNDETGHLIVRVTDTGIGIRPEVLPHIFQAFEQGEVAGQHRFGGLGLGLAISRALIDVHGGEIQAESKGPDCGATFTVILTAVNAPEVSQRVDVRRGETGVALRLLVVEDHEATRSVLMRLLTRKGYRVTATSTVRDALAAAAGNTFDALISDLGLPDGSGFDVLRELRRDHNWPAIALSGFGMEEDIRQTREAGFFAHLVKPVDVAQLCQLLDEVPSPAER